MEDMKAKKESKDKTQKNLEAFQDVAADIKTEETIIKKLMRGYSLGQDEAKHCYDLCIAGMVTD